MHPDKIFKANTGLPPLESLQIVNKDALRHDVNCG